MVHVQLKIPSYELEQHAHRTILSLYPRSTFEHCLSKITFDVIDGNKISNWVSQVNCHYGRFPSVISTKRKIDLKETIYIFKLIPFICLTLLYLHLWFIKMLWNNTVPKYYIIIFFFTTSILGVDEHSHKATVANCIYLYEYYEL